MAYPFVPSEDKSIVKFWKWISSSNSDEKKVMITDHESSQSEALKVYLDSLKDLLCKWKLSVSFNIQCATNQIIKIYCALQSPEIHVHGRRLVDLWISKDLFKVSR